MFKKILYLLLLVMPLKLVALSEFYVFDDMKQQQVFEQLSHEFRCVTCANQNIADSGAPIAKAMREQIYSRLKKGESLQTIRAHLIASYGDYVVYRPQLKEQTVILWAGPFVMLGMGFLLWLSLFSFKEKNR